MYVCIYIYVYVYVYDNESVSGNATHLCELVNILEKKYPSVFFL